MTPPDATRRRRGVRTAVRLSAAAAGCASALTVSFALGGALGLVIATECLTVLALLLLVAHTPRGPLAEPGRLLSEAVSWATRGRVVPGGRAGAGVQAADFPAYLKISSDLGWASMSAWHYDHGTRPLLSRVIEGVLAAGHQPGRAAGLAQARLLIGDDLWPLVDPHSPRSKDSRTPGPDLATLTRIVDRLEKL
jgi:hypothetical protein